MAWAGPTPSRALRDPAASAPAISVQDAAVSDDPASSLPPPDFLLNDQPLSPAPSTYTPPEDRSEVLPPPPPGDLHPEPGEDGHTVYRVFKNERIQNAVNHAVAGDTVWVTAGVYSERIVLKEGVNLRGDGADKTIFSFEPELPGSPAVITAEGQNRIEGIGFIHKRRHGMSMSLNRDEDPPFILVEGSDVKIRDCHFKDHPNIAIQITSAGRVLLEKNLFEGGALGVRGANDETEIRYNTFARQTLALELRNGTQAVIENNIFYRNDRSVFENARGRNPMRGYAVVRDNVFFMNGEERPTVGPRNLPPAVENLAEGNRKADPGFVDASKGDYHLRRDASAQGYGAYLPVSLSRTLDRVSLKDGAIRIEAIEENGEIIGYRIVYQDGKKEGYFEDGRAILNPVPAEFEIISNLPALTKEHAITVEYSINGGTLKTHTFTLAEGPNNLKLTETDAVGNMTEYPIMITSDRTAPVGTVLINGGAEFTNQLGVNLSLTASDPGSGSGIDKVRYSLDGMTWSDWGAFSPAKTVTLVGVDGAKTVQYQIRDRAGNESAFASTIILDTTAPALQTRISGQVLEDVFWLTHPNRRQAARFGDNYAWDGERMLISSANTYPYRAYLVDGDFHSPTFGKILLTLPLPGQPPLQSFGKNVAFLGKNLIVSAPYSGQVYVINGDDRSEDYGQVMQMLTDPQIPSSGYSSFGDGIAVIGQYIAVSDYTEVSSTLDQVGKVYLFDGNSENPTFGQIVHTFSSGIPGQNLFGKNMIALESQLFISSSGGLNNPVYMYETNPASVNFGQMIHSFTLPGSSSIHFGEAIALAGSRLMISDVGASDGGKVYLFDADVASSTFGQILDTLDNPEPGNVTGFGRSLGSDGHYALISGNLSTAVPLVYLFDVDSESPTYGQVLHRIDVLESRGMPDWGRLNLRVLDDHFIIGAPFDDTVATDSGGLYVFEATKEQLTSSTVFTNSESILLNQIVSDNFSNESAIQMAFSLDGGVTFSAFEPFRQDRRLILGDRSGEMNLVIRIKDQAGNRTDVIRKLIFDTEGPSSGSVSINQGAATTNQRTVTLNLSAQDEQGPVTGMRFSLDGGAFQTAVPFQTQFAYELPDADGHHKILVQFKDQAGNWSVVFESSDIILDQHNVRLEKSYSLGERLVSFILNALPGDFEYSATQGLWTNEERDFIGNILDQVMPDIYQLLGDPLQDLVVNLYPYRGYGRGGAYIVNTVTALMGGTLALAAPAGMVSLAENIGSLAHEIAHVFHHTAGLRIGSDPANSLFEEGMAETVEDLVFPAGTLVHPSKPYHSRPDQIHYESAVGEDFLGSFGIVDGVIQRDLGSYFWSKMQLEDPDFLRKFNAAYYEIFRADPGIASDQERILNLVESIKPSVEGITLDQWLAIQNQHLPDPQEFEDRLDQEGLYIRSAYQDRAAVFVHEIVRQRGEAGRNFAIPGTDLYDHFIQNRTVELYIYDANGNLLTTSSGISNSYGNALIDFNIPDNYTGRAELVARTQSPLGEITETRALQTVIQGRSAYLANGYPHESGAIFGVLTTLNEGRITLRKVGIEGTVYSTGVVQGMFNFPQAPFEEGTYELEYTNPYTGETLRRYVTKDKSQYYVQFDTSSLNEDTTPPVISIQAEGGEANGSMRIQLQANKDISKAILYYRVRGNPQGTVQSAPIDRILEDSCEFYLEGLEGNAVYEYWAEAFDLHGFKGRSEVQLFEMP